MQKRKKALQAFANGARNEIINRDQEGQKGLQMDIFVSMTTVSGFFFCVFPFFSACGQFSITLS